MLRDLINDRNLGEDTTARAKLSEVFVLERGLQLLGHKVGYVTQAQLRELAFVSGSHTEGSRKVVLSRILRSLETGRLVRPLPRSVGGLALHAIGAELINRLRSQSDVPHHGNLFVDEALH